MEREYDIISVGIAFGDYSVDRVGQSQLERTVKHLSAIGYKVIAIYDRTDNIYDETDNEVEERYDND